MEYLPVKADHMFGPVQTVSDATNFLRDSANMSDMCRKLSAGNSDGPVYWVVTMVPQVIDFHMGR